MKNEMTLSEVSSDGFSGVSARWMVVDDNEDVLNSMALLLERAGGGTVYRFRSAIKALEAFQADPAAWAVVVTDLEMPGLDGIKLGRQLRALAPELKVFLTTGSCLITEEEAVQLGFRGLLYKPFRVSNLLRMILAGGTPDSGCVPDRVAA